MLPATIGPYKIERQLGRGGMGEVYLACDTRLDRQVAIKALPAHLAQDADRLARFQREAKVLASLNHPGIGAIYGLEEADGHQYLILEYVEGETLADRLANGPIPLEDSLSLAKQIAEALEVAHEKGVIHRDLKPGNVMVTPDGMVKVLDFGLARTEEGSPSSSTAAIAESPTVTSPARNSPTIPGAIMGTAAYMSPEQARGRNVDKRTDIWSFGVVLYEMLVGSSPFQGETVSDSIGAVLHKNLDLDRLPPQTPANVRRVLGRCLMRDRNLRVRDIGDVRLELLCSDDPPVRDPAIGRSLPLWVLPAAGLALIAVAAAAWFAKPVPKPAPTPVVHADIALPEDLQLAHSFMPGIAMSADGRTIAFAAGSPDSKARISQPSAYFRGGLYIRRLDEPEAVPVAGADDAWQPAFSPDGSRIAYVKRSDGWVGRFNGRIETIAITGGRSTPLTTDVNGVAGLDWTDDGRIIFGTAQGLRSIPEGGGPVKVLTGVSDDGAEMGHGFPETLPGGRGVLYTAVYQGRQPSKVAIRVLDLASGQSRELLTNASNARYTRGHIVFARDHTIHAVPFDLETLSVRGEPRPLGMSVIQSYAAPNSAFRNGAAQFAVSDAGDLAYAQGTTWPEFLTPVAWVTRDGEVEVIEADPGSYLAPRADAAGRRILLSNFSEPASAIRMHDITRGVTSRVRRGVGGWVAWGPGPDDYTFSERSDGRERVRWATIGDTAEPFMLDGPAGSVELSLAEWSPDGRHLLCVAREMDKPYDLFAWSKDDGWVNLTNTPDVWEIWPSLSPDGRWISYIAESRVYIRPFLRAGPAIQVSTTQSSAPLWSPDGSELYYRAQVEEPAAATGEGAPGTTETVHWVMAAAVTHSDSGIDIGRPERLFSADGYASVIPIRSWDMGPDGRFLMSMSSPDESVRSAIDKFFPRCLRLIQNWAGTLEERAP
ncbi:MAG: protein kinase [Phycisphaeraceae bacterium]|nr:protein kinase [Phycisphaeraceae bacterium]